MFLYCTTCQTTHPLTCDTCPTCGASLARAPIVTIRPPRRYGQPSLAAPPSPPSRVHTFLRILP